MVRASGVSVFRDKKIVVGCGRCSLTTSSNADSRPKDYRCICGQASLSAIWQSDFVAYLECEADRRYAYGVMAANEVIAAPTATTNPSSTTPPLGYEAALSRAEASARACARSESAASEPVTSWAGSARTLSPAAVSSLPGSP